MSFEMLNVILSLGILGMQCAIVFLFACFVMRNQYSLYARVFGLASEWALYKSFLVVVAASVLTLYYSEVLGFIPCGLCWLERVFLYPQIVLLGVAAWKNDRSIALYSLLLSFCGGIIALYHHYLQMGGASLVPCPASGAGDCAQRIIFEFGFITFPWMAVVVFAYIGILMWCTRVRQ